MPKKKASISGTFMIILIVLGVFGFLFLFKPSVLPVVGEFSPNYSTDLSFLPFVGEKGVSLNFSLSFLPFIGQSGFNTDKINNQPVDELVPTSNLGDGVSLVDLRKQENRSEGNRVSIVNSNYQIKGTVAYLSSGKYRTSKAAENDYDYRKGFWKNKSEEYESWEFETIDKQGIEVLKLKMTEDRGQKFAYKFKVGRVTVFLRGDWSDGNVAKILLDKMFDDLED